MPATSPLILTAQIDEAAQAFYEDLRQRYFPPERNLIQAHLTLFHQLPEDEFAWRTLQDAAERADGFVLGGAQVRSIGRGVAVFFESEALVSLHGALSSAFEEHLITQDRQRLRPHIVVQNKVDSATAQRTLAALEGTALVTPRCVGLTVWRYLGGPWERLAGLPFVRPLPG